MQTFLPYPDFAQSAKVLDYRRLGKQRVEASQIIKAILNPTYGWQRHPAVNMWRGHVEALMMYHDSMIREWITRGYNNNMSMFMIESCSIPAWMSDERLHSSHRSNLLRKNPEWYRQFDWTDEVDAAYWWPGDAT